MTSPPPLPLAIVGCGGIGHRHLYGLAELQRAGLSPGRTNTYQDDINTSLGI